jgi:uncharacterized phage infection (PIP) family protein YhgE
MNESTDTTTTARSGSRAANLKQRIKEDGKEKIETGKRAAADQIAEIADAIDLAGAQLDQSQPTLANYATQIANSVGTFATRLREDSIEDLYHDMRQLATRHPGMFLLGSAAIGLVAARFMKASAEEASYAGDDLGQRAQGESTQDWGEASETVDSEDLESLGRPRETPDPYGSPAYGA